MIVDSLTVVLANRNHAKHLPTALKSILRQTRPADELIVIDDGSTDDSVSIITSYLQNVSYAHFEKNISNIGYIASVNRVIRSARGNVVFFAAADDVFYPALFERGMALLAGHPRAAVFSARTDLIDEEGRNRRLFNTPTPIEVPGYIDPNEVGRLLMYDDSWFMGNVSLYRRANFLAAGGFSEDLASFADGYVARVLALRHGACFTPEVLGAWRRMKSGMAMSHLMSAENVSATVTRVQAKMADEPFPLGYPKRWGRRYFFGAYRAAAKQNRASLSGFQHVWAAVRDSINVVWLFVYLRPNDIVAVLRRRTLRPTRSIFLD